MSSQTWLRVCKARVCRRIPGGHGALGASLCLDARLFPAQRSVTSRWYLKAFSEVFTECRSGL